MRNTINAEKFRHKAMLPFEAPAEARAKWRPEISAKEDDKASINMYDSIGENWDGTGITAKLVSGILRSNKGKDITVNINSPGGDFFEGVAIYNLLKEHDGDVTVKVVGLAASAASIIALAGDTVKIAETGFMMIHNAWTIAIGNKEDMTEVADMLEKFDDTMASLYAGSSDIEEKQIRKMMEETTWLNGKESVEMGFAHSLLDSDMVEEDEEEKANTNAALRRIDLALAKDGMPRSKRRELFKELSGRQNAADMSGTPSAAVIQAMPSAGDLNEALKGLLNNIS